MISKSGTTRSGIPQVQSILIAAITLFAFSGLMVGFTVGALVRPTKPSTNSTNQTNPVSATSTPIRTPSPTATTIALGCPEFGYTTINPDGIPVYSATIQAKDKTGLDANKQCHVPLEKPVTVDGIICRIWLVPGKTNVIEDLINNREQLQRVDTFNQPFPHEIRNALIFDPTTPNQVQPCQQGKAQWKFALAPSVGKGTYSLVGLTDWQGKAWNWSWSTITVDGGKDQEP